MRRFQSILMPVAEAESAVEPFRRDGDWSSAHGVPAHITIAGPWPSSLRLPTEPLTELAAAIQGTRFTLGRAGALGDAVCLFPDDDGELLLWRARILDVVGIVDAIDEGWRLHPTVCRGIPREEIGAVEASLGKSLPIICEVRRLLLAQTLDDSEVTLRQL